MKRSKKRTSATKLFLLICAISSFQLMAQKAPAEFSVHAAGAISTYCFQPLSKGNSSIGGTGDFGAGFTGFLSQQIGIHVGVGIGFFNVKSKIANLKTITPQLSTIDDQGRVRFYDLHTTLSGYTEIHKSIFMSIPVMLQYQTQQKQYWGWKQSPKPSFYAMAGLKVLFLFNNKYEASIQTLENIGKFEMGPPAGTQEAPGFGVFAGNQSSGKMDFGIMAMAAVELGVKFRLGNNVAIYTGAFFDCGLNDPIKDSRKSYGNYIYQEDLNELTILKAADRINLMTVGIKVRVAFSKSQRPY